MFQFPSSPDTLVTRQIECVSCREIFTISEDYAMLESTASEYWRMAPDQYADINLRYHPQKGRKPTIPETRTEPDYEPSPILAQRRSQRAHINCPRCGTDNRNWMHIINPPRGASFGRNSWWERFRTAYWGAFLAAILAVGGLGVALLFQQTLSYVILLMVITFLGIYFSVQLITNNWNKQRIHGIVRQQNQTLSFMQRLPPATRTGLVIFIILALFIPFFLYILMPGVMDLLIPELPLEIKINQAIANWDTTFQQATPEDLLLFENTAYALQTMVDEHTFECKAATLTPMIVNLEALQNNSADSTYDLLLLTAIGNLKALRDSNAECRPEMILATMLSLKALADFCQPTSTFTLHQNPIYFLPTGGKESSTQSLASTSSTGKTGSANSIYCNNVPIQQMLFALNTLIEPPVPGSSYDQTKHALESISLLALTTQNSKELAAIEEKIDLFNEVAESAGEPSERLRRLTSILIWVTVVGLTTFVAAAFALMAVNSFITTVNLNIPRSIGFSIANMSRVVTRDLRHSLDIADNVLNQIQWVQVTRNNNGGLSMKGIIAPEIDPETQTGNYRMAQCCTVSTDLWARIEEAEIKFCRVPNLPTPSQPRDLDNSDNIEIERLFRGEPSPTREHEPVES